MTTLRIFERSVRVSGRSLCRLAFATLFAFVAACGSGDAPPPNDIPPTGTAPVVVAVAPTITQQPVNVNTMPAQSATFTVVATGTAPLVYQWQRNGAAITGATTATYTLASAAITDTGATFGVVVSNAAGSATSNNATLVVTMATLTLTISPQPANVSVTAGTSASFMVGGACSNGTLTIQWQRLVGGAFADIAGATSATYSLMSSAADNGAEFRATLSCSGLATTSSNVATLGVTTPSAVTLSQLPVAGLQNQAVLGSLNGIDPSPAGGWDFTSNYAIRHLAADLSSVTLVAGSTFGSSDGPASTATFGAPESLVHDASGNLYVADATNQTIRRIATDGTVTTIAGSTGVAGFVDGTGTGARFSGPVGITLGPDGDLYVVDQGNAAIRRVSPAGVVTTYAGSGTPGFAEGAPLTAKFSTPWAVVTASNGDLYVADYGNHRVRRIARAGNVAGNVSTLAGTGSNTTPGLDGPGATAGVPFPRAVVISGTTLSVLDGAGTIRSIDLGTSIVSTFAGSRTLTAGYADGPVGTGRLYPTFAVGGFTPRSGGGFIVADQGGLRVVDASGTITTIAAGISNIFTTPTGTGVLAQLPFLVDDDDTSVVTDPSGRVAISENVTNEVRRIDATGNVSLVAGLAFAIGSVDGTGSVAQFTINGQALAVGADGTLYVTNHAGVSRIGTDGTATFLTGSLFNNGAMDGPVGTALFRNITSLAVAPSGILFAADRDNFAIRRIDATGTTTTYAGVLGQQGYVDGAAAAARFQSPQQLAFAPDGTMYVLDFATAYAGGSAVRRVATDGTVSTVAGGAGAFRIAVDPSGALYIAVHQSSTSSIGVLDPTSGVFTPAIATGPTVVVGNVAPSLGPTIGSMAIHATKQIVVVSGGQLLVVTLP